jgi:hypothetical protein
MPHFPTLIGGGTLITGKDALPLVPVEWRSNNGPLGVPPAGQAGFMETRTYALVGNGDDPPALARAVRVTTQANGEWAVVALPNLKHGANAERLLTRAVDFCFRAYLLPYLTAKAEKGDAAQ